MQCRSDVPGLVTLDQAMEEPAIALRQLVHDPVDVEEKLEHPGMNRCMVPEKVFLRAAAGLPSHSITIAKPSRHHREPGDGISGRIGAGPQTENRFLCRVFGIGGRGAPSPGEATRESQQGLERPCGNIVRVERHESSDPRAQK